MNCILTKRQTKIAASVEASDSSVICRQHTFTIPHIVTYTTYLFLLSLSLSRCPTLALVNTNAQAPARYSEVVSCYCCWPWSSSAPKTSQVWAARWISFFLFWPFCFREGAGAGPETGLRPFIFVDCRRSSLFNDIRLSITLSLTLFRDRPNWSKIAKLASSFNDVLKASTTYYLPMYFYLPRERLP